MVEIRFLGIHFLEWIGYAASILVLISLSMSSIIKLRWYNLVGALLFSTYGFLIGSLPVGIVNILIMLANIYNLKNIYSRTEDFMILEIKKEDSLLPHLVEFYKKDIHKFFPGFYLSNKKETVNFLILRNMAVAGIFAATKENDYDLKIELDYALPRFRDFKVGNYLYAELDKILGKQGYRNLNCYVDLNFKYLKKMGFMPNEIENQKIMQKKISNSVISNH